MSISPETIWAASDYAPTARRMRAASGVVADRLRHLLPDGSRIADIGSGHGDTAAALLHRGFAVTAVEPVARMLEVGQAAVPDATWVAATGEATGLPTGSFDGVASAFGSMFCDPVVGPAEWARLLCPGGGLVMTAWDRRGFLSEMTDRMMDVLNPGGAPPHMAWGDPGVADERLSPHFEEITLSREAMAWNFDSVEAGMDLYVHGSPTHAWSLAQAGPRREELLTALREHLESHADADGRIRTEAAYVVITARRAGTAETPGRSRPGCE